MCSTAFGGLARAQAKALGAPDQPLLIIEHPFGSRSREEVAALAATLVERIAETVRLAAAAGAARAGADTGAAPAAGAADGRLIELPADIEAFHQACSDRRWSDGLPVIPPTPARVARMLSGSSLPPTAVVATLAPGFGAATVELIAVNAVMAGCLPAHLPVLIAAVEAAADPAFNLQAVQSTTNPVTTWLIVNGPIALALGMNAGINCLGQGNLPNATLGRALRLVMQNIGGAWPAEMDRATHGQPGKFLFCCAENEAASPW
ncbi:MAG: UGSC family (seleno)protein, partial [bacterium]